ncbi:inositol monophosphatase family protein [Pelagicoccus mobilis]
MEELLLDVSEKEILPRWRNLKEQEIDEKSPGEVVTPADRACEAYLQQQLPRILPGSVVIGEESVHENAGLLRALQTDKPVWVIDPLDGTSNFAKGKEPFAVMACLIQKGDVS